jgi:hypothetical protein
MTSYGFRVVNGEDNRGVPAGMIIPPYGGGKILAPASPASRATVLEGDVREGGQKPRVTTAFNLKSYFNTLTSNPVQAFKEQPIISVVLLLVLLKLLKVW